MAKASKKTSYKVVPPGKKKCIWMEAGVVSYKLCDNNFDCQTCSYDHAMQRKVSRERASMPTVPQVAGPIPEEFTPTWVEQYSLLLIVYIGFLGASVGVHKKIHLGVSVFREISPKPVRRFFDFLSHSILAGFGALMTVYGYKLTIFKWSAPIPLINISEGIRSLPIMLSGALILLYSIGHLIHFFQHTHQEDAE